MRAVVLCGLFLSALVIAGCSSEKPKDGKPAEKAKFSLEGLPEKTRALNGKDATLTASVSWSGSPKEEVRLAVTVAPADMGVTARVEPTVLKPPEQSLKVIVSVGESAASGDYKVKLTGKSDSAGEASVETTVQVPKKE
jgi:uncharacterized membrane protein